MNNLVNILSEYGFVSHDHHKCIIILNDDSMLSYCLGKLSRKFRIEFISCNRHESFVSLYILFKYTNYQVNMLVEKCKLFGPTFKYLKELHIMCKPNSKKINFRNGCIKYLFIAYNKLIEHIKFNPDKILYLQCESNYTPSKYVKDANIKLCYDMAPKNLALRNAGIKIQRSETYIPNVNIKYIDYKNYRPGMTGIYLTSNTLLTTIHPSIKRLLIFRTVTDEDINILKSANIKSLTIYNILLTHHLEMLLENPYLKSLSIWSTSFNISKLNENTNLIKLKIEGNNEYEEHIYNILLRNRLYHETLRQRFKKMLEEYGAYSTIIDTYVIVIKKDIIPNLLREFHETFDIRKLKIKATLYNNIIIAIFSHIGYALRIETTINRIFDENFNNIRHLYIETNMNINYECVSVKYLELNYHVDISKFAKIKYIKHKSQFYDSYDNARNIPIMLSKTPDDIEKFLNDNIIFKYFNPDFPNYPHKYSINSAKNMVCYDENVDLSRAEAIVVKCNLTRNLLNKITESQVRKIIIKSDNVLNQGLSMLLANPNIQYIKTAIYSWECDKDVVRANTTLLCYVSDYSKETNFIQSICKRNRDELRFKRTKLAAR